MPEPNAFTKTGLTVDEIMEEDLYGVLLKARGEAAPLPTTAIFNKIRAAEDYYEKRLQVSFGPKRIASNARARLGLSGEVGLTADDYDRDDVGFDFDMSWFQRGRWGQFSLHYRPVASVERVFLALPGSGYASPWVLPRTWLQVDYKAGQIEIVPLDASNLTAMRMQLMPMMLSLLTGGTRIPKVLHVDYTVGLTKAQMLDDQADLLELIRLRTVLTSYGIITTVRTGGGIGGHTLSLDGLSQSENLMQGKFGPFSGQIELAMARMEEIETNWLDDAQPPILMAAV